MTTLEAIELFELEMLNEIFHNVSDNVLQDILITALKEVKSTVVSSYEASKNDLR